MYPTDRRGGSRIRSRGLVLFIAFLSITFGIGLTLVPAPAAAATCTTLTGPTTITTPGCYVLTGDVENATSEVYVDVLASDVYIDGQGYRLDGIGGTDPFRYDSVAVRVGNDTAVSNVTIVDLTVTDWEVGVYGVDIAGLTVRNFHASDGFAGVLIPDSDSVIERGTFENVSFGVSVSLPVSSPSTSTTGVLVTDTNVRDSGFGISSLSAPVVVRDLTAERTDEAIEIRDADGVTVERVTLTAGFVGVSFARVSNASITDLTASGTSEPIVLEATRDVTVERIDIDTADTGIVGIGNVRTRLIDLTATRSVIPIGFGTSEMVTVRDLAAGTTTGGLTTATDGPVFDRLTDLTIENASIYVSQTGLTLRDSQNVTVVGSTIGGPLQPVGLGIDSSSNATTIRDTSIRASQAISITSDSIASFRTDTTLENVVVDGTATEGISIPSGSALTVANSTFTGLASVLRGGAMPIDYELCQFDVTGELVCLTSTSGSLVYSPPTIGRFSFVNNTFEDNAAIFEIQNIPVLVIRENLIRNNGQVLNGGATFAAVVEGNDFIDNDAGLWALDAPPTNPYPDPQPRFVVADNRFERTGAPVDFDRMSDVIVRGNDIDASTTVGPAIRLVVADNLTIADNRITNVTGPGAVVESVTNSVVAGNLFQDISDRAVIVRGVGRFGRSDLQENTVRRSTGGIFVRDIIDGGLRIHDNAVTGGTVGIEVESVSADPLSTPVTLSVTNNTVTEADIGLSLRGVIELAAIGNTLTGNNRGLSVDGALDLTIADSNLRSNTLTGLSVERETDGLTVANVSAGTNGEWALLAFDRQQLGTVTEFDVGPAPDGRPTVVGLDAYANVALQAAAVPAPVPSGYLPLGSYVAVANASELGGFGQFTTQAFQGTLSIAYDGTTLSSFDEPLVELWGYDPVTATWFPAPGSSVDTTADIVTGELTAPGVYTALLLERNLAPTAAFDLSSSAIDEGGAITVDASQSDDLDGSIVAYEWSFGDGTTATGVTATHTYVEDGDYTVTLTVVDNEDGMGTASETVSVANAPPTVESLSLPNETPEGTAATLAATLSDPGHLDTHTATIDWGDGTVGPTSVVRNGNRLEVTDSHAYADNGAYTVTLTVTDDDGGSVTTTGDVTITNVVPTLAVVFDANPATLTVSFIGTVTDPGSADTHTATVDWGDGTTETVPVVDTGGSLEITGSHTYGTGGVYIVTVTVVDDDGGSATVDESVRLEVRVGMDVKPGNNNEVDPLNLREGTVPVAVLTADGFDAGSVDITSLRLGTEATLAAGRGATVAHDGHLEDVDGDGDLDLVVHFTGETGLASGDDTVTLRGSITDGTPIVGTDAIRVVGQR